MSVTLTCFAKTLVKEQGEFERPVGVVQATKRTDDAASKALDASARQREQAEFKHLIGMFQAIRNQRSDILKEQEQGIATDKKVAEIAPEALDACAKKRQEQLKAYALEQERRQELILTHAKNKKEKQESIEQQKASIAVGAEIITQRTQNCKAAIATLKTLETTIPDLVKVEQIIQEFEIQNPGILL
jgi:hypothetical protein